MHDDDGQRPGESARARREAAQVLSRLGGQPGGPEPTEAVLVIDTHPTMRVWHETVRDDLVDELERA
ncbi:hypothetical protein AB0O67_18480, partial [Streptomyces sp. NPDC086077]|uniref:hypothetical protein n=1 Tax=Streptomyces sp. NPDC086077 TaxID=3154862 RepID=UPI0034223DA2